MRPNIEALVMKSIIPFLLSVLFVIVDDRGLLLWGLTLAVAACILLGNTLESLCSLIAKLYKDIIDDLVAVHRTIYLQYVGLLTILALVASTQLPGIFSHDATERFGALIVLSRYNQYVFNCFILMPYCMLTDYASTKGEFFKKEKHYILKCYFVFIYVFNVYSYLYMLSVFVTLVDNLPSASEVKVLESYNCLAMDEQHFELATKGHKEVDCQRVATPINKTAFSYNYNAAHFGEIVSVLIYYFHFADIYGKALLSKTTSEGDAHIMPANPESETGPKKQINPVMPLPRI